MIFLNWGLREEGIILSIDPNQPLQITFSVLPFLGTKKKKHT